MTKALLAANQDRAAMYVRMSTEHQQYSIQNQSDAIESYAAQRNLNIVQKFIDSGRSGVSLSGRAALRELLKQVESRVAGFRFILVYDVSRWGRFQDADESAYYEYVCKRAGVQVHYCAEQFQNDGSIASALLKTIKRAMAAEFSRELSVKTFAGQSRLVEMGFRQGGPAGFGLRRQLMAQDGSIKGILAIGDRKSLQTDRVILIPGPEEEVSVVRDIFALFTEQHKSERQIAEVLNERGVKTDMGRVWSTRGVQLLITNPKYMGSNIFNRESVKLHVRRVRNPSDMWIRRDAAFIAIVPPEQFLLAQKIVQARCTYFTDEQLLEKLKVLWHRVGRLSMKVIDTAEDMPHSDTYWRRFKTVRNAYSLIGYTPTRNYEYKAANKQVRLHRQDLREEVKATLRAHGATVEDSGPDGLLLINSEFTMCLVVCRCRETRWGGRYAWVVQPAVPCISDLTIAVRLEPGNRVVRDYFVFPSIDRLPKRVVLREDNPIHVEVYRFASLDSLLTFGRRAPTRNTVAIEKQKASAAAKHPTGQNQLCRGRSTSPAVKVYKRQTATLNSLVERADRVRDRLSIAQAACLQMFADEHFVNLLRGEGKSFVPLRLLAPTKNLRIYQPTNPASRQKVVELALVQLVELKDVTRNIASSRKYKAMRASLSKVGLGEPLTLIPQSQDRYLVVDGNMRLHILRELKISTARCAVPSDCESYKYSQRVTAVSPIPEHFLLLEAIANGITEERIAVELGVGVNAIHRRISLLDGICREAVELLQEKRVSAHILSYLRKMKPYQQVSTVNLMISQENYSPAFAAAILGVTPLHSSKMGQNSGTARADSVHPDLAKRLVNDLAGARATYGVDVINLTIICRYLEHLMQSAAVVKYLRRNNGPVLFKVQKIVSQTSAERPSQA